MHARFPSGHGFHNTDGLGIELAIHTSQISYIGNATVFFNNKSNKDTSLNAFFLGFLGIMDILGNELKQLSLASWKCRHLFNNLINNCLWIFNLAHFRSHISFGHSFFILSSSYLRHFSFYPRVLILNTTNNF